MAIVVLAQVAIENLLHERNMAALQALDLHHHLPVRHGVGGAAAPSGAR